MTIQFRVTPHNPSLTQTITLACATPGASIYYTTDGSLPTNASTLYAAPFIVPITTVVRALAVKAGNGDSLVSSSDGSFPVGLVNGPQVVDNVRFWINDWVIGFVLWAGSQVQGSNDMLSWDTLWTLPAEPLANAWNSASFPNTTSYRYYRWYSAAGGSCAMNEVEFRVGSNVVPFVSVFGTPAAPWNLPGWIPENIFDGLTTTRFASQIANGYAGIDLGPDMVATPTITSDTPGLFASLNNALVAAVTGLNSGFYPADSIFEVILDDIANFEVVPLTLTLARLVNARIDIIPAPSLWQQARIAPSSAQWLTLVNAVPGQCKIRFYGVICSTAGVFVDSQTSDIEYNGCVMEGTGTFARMGEGQLTIHRTVGVPLDVVIDGDQATAALSADGLLPTLDRPSLVVTNSFVGAVRTTKPVQITDCWTEGQGVASYEETIDLPLDDHSRASHVRIGSLLDRIRLKFIGLSDPLVTIRDGGLYRRLIMVGEGGLTAETEPTALIRIQKANKKTVSIDRCLFGQCKSAIDIIEGAGEVRVTNNVFNDVSFAGVNLRVIPWTGWLTVANNRGSRRGGKLVTSSCLGCGPGFENGWKVTDTYYALGDAACLHVPFGGFSEQCYWGTPDAVALIALPAGGYGIDVVPPPWITCCHLYTFPDHFSLIRMVLSQDSAQLNYCHEDDCDNDCNDGYLTVYLKPCCVTEAEAAAPIAAYRAAHPL